MAIPYYIFPIVYLVIVAIYFFFAILNFYHIVKFGFFDFSGKLNTFLYLAVNVVVIFFTWFFLRDIDWTQSLTIRF